MVKGVPYRRTVPMQSPGHESKCCETLQKSRSRTWIADLLERVSDPQEEVLGGLPDYFRIADNTSSLSEG